MSFPLGPFGPASSSAASTSAPEDGFASPALGLMGAPLDPGSDSGSWDPVEAYFECITTCSLEDGECVTQCVERLREES